MTDARAAVVAEHVVRIIRATCVAAAVAIVAGCTAAATGDDRVRLDVKEISAAAALGALVFTGGVAVLAPFLRIRLRALLADTPAERSRGFQSAMQDEAAVMDAALMTFVRRNHGALKNEFDVIYAQVLSRRANTEADVARMAAQVNALVGVPDLMHELSENIGALSGEVRTLSTNVGRLETGGDATRKVIGDTREELAGLRGEFRAQYSGVERRHVSDRRGSGGRGGSAD